MARAKESSATVLLPEELKKRFPDQFPDVVEHHVTVRIVVDRWVMQHPQTGQDIELEAVPKMKLIGS